MDKLNESIYNEITTEYDREKEVWVRAWLASISKNEDYMTPDVATKNADDCLKDYKERFV